MIGCLAPRPMRSANWRAIVSVAPPAAKGTTNVIGRSGYCAASGRAAARAAAANSVRNTAFMLPPGGVLASTFGETEILEMAQVRHDRRAAAVDVAHQRCRGEARVLPFERLQHRGVLA